MYNCIKGDTMKVKTIENKRSEGHIILDGVLNSIKSKYYGCISDEVMNKLDELLELVSDRNPELDEYSDIGEIEFIERCTCYKED